MHTIACARAQSTDCACSCNHTLHGYLSGVLSSEQYRRVREPVIAEVARVTGQDIPASHALHELDHLLGQASGHLAAGALSSETLATLISTVLDASADQESADAHVVAEAETDALEALAVAEAEGVARAEAEAVADAATVAAAEANARADVVSEAAADAVATAEDEVAEAEALEQDAERRAEVAEEEAAAAYATAAEVSLEAEERVGDIEARAEADVAAARQAAHDMEEMAEARIAEAELRAAEAESRAADAESRAAEVADAAALAIADAEVTAEAATAVAMDAQAREERAEATTAWALGQLHLLCGLCVAGVTQVEAAEDDATIAVSDFLDATFSATGAQGLGDDELDAVRSSVETVLGAQAAESLLTLDSMPSATDLKVLAIAFCPDPSDHTEVAQFQADLTSAVVASWMAQN